MGNNVLRIRYGAAGGSNAGTVGQVRRRSIAERDRRRDKSGVRHVSAAPGRRQVALYHTLHNLVKPSGTHSRTLRAIGTSAACHMGPATWVTS